MHEVANPWVVQAPKQVAQVPNGFYNAKFQGVSEVKLPPSKPDDTGERWRFAWEVKTGPEAGKVASALTDRTINANTLTGRLIAGLLGRALVADEDVKASIEGCVGKVYMVTVQPGPKNGKPGVKSVGTPPAGI